MLYAAVLVESRENIKVNIHRDQFPSSQETIGLKRSLKRQNKHETRTVWAPAEAAADDSGTREPSSKSWVTKCLSQWLGALKTAACESRKHKAVSEKRTDVLFLWERYKDSCFDLPVTQQEEYIIWTMILKFRFTVPTKVLENTG